MKCGSCGHDIDPAGKFCGKCGASIPKEPAMRESDAGISSAQPRTPIISQTKTGQCAVCGFANDPGVKFCGKCGAQMPEESENNDTAADRKHTLSSILGIFKAMPTRRLLKYILPTILIVAAIIVVVPRLGGPNASKTKDNISFWEDGDTTVVSGNHNAKFTIDGAYHSAQRSIDDSKAVVLTITIRFRFRFRRHIVVCNPIKLCSHRR